jgi:hypothetical protein
MNFVITATCRSANAIATAATHDYFDAEAISEMPWQGFAEQIKMIGQRKSGDGNDSLRAPLAR